jgi:glycine C-acetyltransferase
LGKQELTSIKGANLYKDERLASSPTCFASRASRSGIILSDQKVKIKVSYPANSKPKEALNFCSNNYLGLANHPDVIKVAQKTLDTHGFGLS